MKLALAADHAGFELKNTLLTDLRSAGVEVEDLGAYEFDRQDDYPDYAERLATAIASGRVDRGIVLCGSGVGVCVAINKYKGVRAGICHDTYSAHQGVEHDDMNVLCLGSRIVGFELAREVARAFALAKFSNEERHVRRLAKVRQVEERNFRG
jgi:ribose 5-phosphate isomerase B